VIPLASLMALWALSAATTLSAALQRRDSATIFDRIATPVGGVLAAIEQERAAATVALAAPSSGNVTRFQGLTAKTDAAVATFRKTSLAPETYDLVKDPTPQRLQELDRSLGALRTIRSQVDSRGITPLRVIERYSDLFDSGMGLMTTLVQVDDVAVYRQGNAVLAIFWSQDMMLRESAVLSAARVGTNNKMTAADRTAFAEWAGSRQVFFGIARAGLQGEIAQILQRLANAPAFGTYLSLESGVVDEGTAPRMREWQATIGTLTPMWAKTTQQSADVLTNKIVDSTRQKIMVRFYAVGGAGLLAVIAAVALSLLFARRLTKELRGLERTAQVLAHDRLPRVVARLRRGERVDGEVEAPRPATGGTREIARVSDAFAEVQRTAIGSAVGEAELRASINRVFVNLSWRSQSLLHRQLRLLDEMERRASSPEELEDLFRLDHLTTRMRRHAEGLVILSGSPAMRAWDHPVAAEDLVRAAIAEVEDYKRVEVVVGAMAAAVTGAAVADVIHLLAELIENATSFSPPNTEVTVWVDTVANGLAIEVVDRGFGLHADERAELNRRISNPVEFDLADTDRLGLFVVARLAAMHGIIVSLQPSAYGGTTAVVLIPHSLVVLEGEAPPVHSTLLNGTGTRRGRVARAVQYPDRPSGPVLSEPIFHPSSPGSPASLDNPLAAAGDGAASPRDATAHGPTGSHGPTAPHRAADRRGATSPEDTADPESSEITGRLPRRVRQRNLAPQLRRPAHGDAGGRPPEDNFAEPSPEFSRHLMTSLQSGWVRGRADEETDDNDPRDNWGDDGEDHERGNPGVR
jgi:signal transduction histidine kinase